MNRHRESGITLPFRDRKSAGHALAFALEDWRGRDRPLVLALPRGGIPVALEVATALDAELDLLLVRKLGAPGNPELAMGAIASGGIRVMNMDVVRTLGIPSAEIEHESALEAAELERRARIYRGARPAPAIAGRTVILVDDGVATGATMRAAIGALRTQGAASVIVAVPVAPPATVALLEGEADAVVCLAQPADFGAIGRFYLQFEQLGDEEVSALLDRAWRKSGPTD